MDVTFTAFRDKVILTTYPSTRVPVWQNNCLTLKRPGFHPHSGSEIFINYFIRIFLNFRVKDKMIFHSHLMTTTPDFLRNELFYRYPVKTFATATRPVHGYLGDHRWYSLSTRRRVSDNLLRDAEAILLCETKAPMYASYTTFRGNSIVNGGVVRATCASKSTEHVATGNMRYTKVPAPRNTQTEWTWQWSHWSGATNAQPPTSARQLTRVHTIQWWATTAKQLELIVRKSPRYSLCT